VRDLGWQLSTVSTLEEDESKGANEAPRDSALRLRRLVEANNVGIFVAEDDRIVEANDCLLDLIGYTRKALGRGEIRWRSLTAPEFSTLEEIARRELVSSGAVMPYEMELIHADSGRVPVWIGSSLLTESPLTWICVAVDLTGRKRAEERVREINATLEAKVAQHAAQEQRRTSTLAALASGLTRAAQAGTRDGFGLLDIAERLRSLCGPLEERATDGQGFGAAQAETCGSPELETKTAPGERRLRVLLADDHPVTRQGLVRLLEGQADIEVVGEAMDGRQAVVMTSRLRPDVVVMDVSMPRLNGIDATREIVAISPHTRVIGLSMYEPADIAKRMQQAGAAAYLTKGGSCQELLSAIRGG
jgi:PAS domain S-box-containing protein